MTKKTDEDFMKVLEGAVRKVLTDTNATAKERIAAIQAGVTLVEKRHKMSDSGDKKGSFFDKG